MHALDLIAAAAVVLCPEIVRRGQEPRPVFGEVALKRHTDRVGKARFQLRVGTDRPARALDAQARKLPQGVSQGALCLFTGFVQTRFVKTPAPAAVLVKIQVDMRRQLRHIGFRIYLIPERGCMEPEICAR